MLKRFIQETHYRMKLRKELQNSPIEVVKITIEEGQREYDRRKKELSKKTNKRK